MEKEKSLAQDFIYKTLFTDWKQHTPVHLWDVLQGLTWSLKVLWVHTYGSSERWCCSNSCIWARDSSSSMSQLGIRNTPAHLPRGFLAITLNVSQVRTETFTAVGWIFPASQILNWNSKIHLSEWNQHADSVVKFWGTNDHKQLQQVASPAPRESISHS